MCVYVCVPVCVCVCVCQLTRRVEELQQTQRERDEAVLLQTALERSLEELEDVSQGNAHAKEEKTRHLKLMEVPRTAGWSSGLGD